jgi:integrase
MKVMEVLERVLAGKRLSEARRRNMKYAYISLAKVTGDWPGDVETINRWVASMPASYSDETVEHYFETVKAGGNYIQKISGRNPDGSFRFFNVFVDAEKPRVKTKQRRYLKADDMVGVLKACRGEREIALISTIIDSACRVGDLAGLRSRDIGDHYFISYKGKTGQLRYRLDSRICFELKKLAKTDDGFVFRMKRDDSKPCKANNLAQEVRKIMMRSGLTGKKLGGHTLRHSGASLVARKTGSALIVKELLQHTKIETSMLYIHDVEDELTKDISPMAMINVIPLEQAQLRLPDSKPGDVEVVDGQTIFEGDDLTDEMFDVVPDGIGVRPLLKSKDLKLVRSVVVEFARVYRGDSRIYEMQELIRRILRKVK